MAWQPQDARRDPGHKQQADHQHDFELRIAQLQQQFEQKAREAHEAGLREGEQAAGARARADLQSFHERLARTIEDTGRLRARLRKEAEADVVKLALAIARRVLRRELAVDPEALRGLVLAALEKLEGQEVTRVKVHPSHVEPVTAFLRQSPGASKIEVVGDASREPGAAIFETTRGNLDASVDSLLQEVERGLTDLLRRHA